MNALEFVSMLNPHGIDRRAYATDLPFTVDLTGEQITYVRRLVLWDVSTQQQNLRKLEDPYLYEQMRTDTQRDIRIGSELIGKLPVVK